MIYKDYLFLIRLIILFYFTIFTFNNANSQGVSKYNIDSLTKKLTKVYDEKSKLKILNDLAYAYQFSDPNKGIEYAKAALTIANTSNNIDGMATSNGMIGLNFSAKGDLKNATYYQTLALKYFKSNNNNKGAAATLSNLSTIYINQSDYTRALEVAFEALKFYESSNSLEHQAYVLDNIGTIYLRKKRYDSAIQNFNSAKLIYNRLNLTDGKARVLGNLGQVYAELNQHKEALKILNQAYLLNYKSRNIPALEVISINIGNVFLNNNLPDSAIKYYYQAKELAIQSGNQINVIGIDGNIGRAYLTKYKLNKTQLNKYLLENARLKLDLAIKQCKLLNLVEMQLEFLNYLSEIYELNKNYEKALVLYHTKAKIADSLQSYHLQQKFNSLEANRNIELLSKNIQIKEQELKINNLKFKNSRNNQIILALISILLVIIGYYFWWRYKRQRSYNRALIDENIHSSQLISEQIKAIEKHSMVLKEIAYMQAHQVRGPVSTLIGLVNLFNKTDLNSPDNKYVIENIESVVNKIDIAVKNVIHKERETNQHLNK